MISLATPEERFEAAGEFVLGTLAPEDREAVVAAMQRDTALAADVYRWQDRLLPLSALVAPSRPSAALWQRLERRTDAAAAMRPAPASTPTPMRWWQRAAPWQGIGGLAIAASLLLAVLLVQKGIAPADVAPRFVAMLQSPADRSTGWVVEVDTARGVRLIPVGRAEPAPDGRALQFWTKPQGAAGPTSLGLVQAGVPLELPVSALPAVGDDQLFEITLEPPGGSTIGRPTGPILYVGRSVHL